MNEEICDNCMYSSNTEVSMMINDIMHNNLVFCNHHNSPNFMRLIKYDNYCRLFENERLYFLKQDRINKLDNLNDKNKFNNI